MAVPGAQAEVAAFLANLAGADAVETHISAVFLGPDTVWKLKKAVRLGFLDFSAVSSRQHFLERELQINAAFAPGLYRDVVAITREGVGLTLGGPGAVVDWVLRMARVPHSDFLDEMAAAGRVDTPLLRALADEVAAMHRAQLPVGCSDPLGQMLVVVEGNAKAARAAGLEPGMVEAWQAGMVAALERASPALRERAPLIRRAHGDLHLGNLLMWQGRPAPFDALEFDEALATIDPGYDLAFLLMDLEMKVSRVAANQVLCRYVARTGDAGLVGALGPFLSLRAMIRAHVEASRGRDAASLVRAATAYLEPRRAVVVAIGGLMGTGKSTLARALAPGLGGAPGALVLRSDEVRKRLNGVAPETRLPAAAYSPEATRRAHAALMADLELAAGGNHAVIADGTFLDASHQQDVAASARTMGVPFLGVWLEAPLPELERRVAARQGDASDATVAVLRAAAAKAVPPEGWMRLEAGPVEAMQQRVQSRLAVL